MATSVTLSSVGVSGPINVDWRGTKPVTVVATLGSTSMTTDFTIQYTLDDIQLTATQTWISAGSSTGSSATHFSSANADAGVTMGFAYPIAALRLSSTAISASSITLKMLQGAGW
jgi:hypothetical protein